MEEKALQVYSDDQIALIKKTVAVGTTNDELALFLYTSKKTGLDPLTRQVHCVKRGGKMTIQVGIDGLRVIAERTGNYAGNDDYEYNQAFIEGKTNVPLWAKATVHKMVNGEKCSYSATARWKEYSVSYNGKLGNMWQKMPALMLGKCAEALALRKAFPQDLSGLYTTDEMEQADGDPKTVDAEIVDNSNPDKIKRDIIGLVHSLGNPAKTAEEYIKAIKALTGLDLKEENYSEILERLQVLYKEKKESQEDPTEDITPAKREEDGFGVCTGCGAKSSEVCVDDCRFKNVNRNEKPGDTTEEVAQD